MEKTRVPKGKYYWWIDSDRFQTHFAQDTINDDYSDQSDNRYEVGNYFNSFSEAETIARKLRAVLNGAEVIEMPSNETITNFANDRYPHFLGDEENEKLCNVFLEGVEFLKSKVVK